MSLFLTGESASARSEEERWIRAALSWSLALLLLCTGGECTGGEGELENTDADGGEGEHLCDVSSQVGVVARVEVSETETERDTEVDIEMSDGAELVIESVRRVLDVGLEFWCCAGVECGGEDESSWLWLSGSTDVDGAS